ncbi:hypothetical protein F1529_12150 [Alcanivorax sp. VBW004]|uniref:hypothetical protein n=1 Tax=Alcanivorax sp. VBW004 TaxID=1287708 RepID=UPI0012BC5D67|nr:hypothetical protein [Alcanivorax sp. VBW004]MTT53238.1 hypothetical protein [Alcanivorax sp. VBW004]
MRALRLTLLFVFVFLAGCSPGTAEDAEVKAAVAEVVDNGKVVAIYRFGQMVVNVNGQKAFDLSAAKRKELALGIANAALEVRPDVDSIMIGFGRVEPEIQQIAYVWENQNGALTFVSPRE